jgi:glutamate dehydrogenase (NAD(P)+)
VVKSTKEASPDNSANAYASARVMAPSDEMTPFEAATFFFHQSADRLGLRDDMREVLSTTYRELAVQVPLRMDDGKMVVLRGYRIQHMC